MQVSILDERSSSGIVKDYYSLFSSEEYKPAPYYYRVLMDMCEADPILFAAINLTVDLCTYNGYDFNGKNTREIERIRKLFDDKFDFDQVIENLIWQLIVYGDAYLEVVWDEARTEVMELHPLETTEIEIKYNEFGDILGYRQKVDTGGKEVLFPPDSVIYFRMHWVGTQVQSRCPFKSIVNSFATKVYSNNYLQSIFRNLPPKIVYFLKNSNKEQRKLFIENLKRAKTNPNIDLVALGEAFESKLMEVSFDSGLIQVLEYLRKEVLMVTRVPPHWVGILDGANRGIGENVVIPYETRIKKIQQKIASQINRELMPKLKMPNIEFRWNAISLLDEKSIVSIMQMLTAQGFDSETIIQYAKDHGLNLRDGAVIKPPMSGAPQIQRDGAPSRQRNDKKTDTMKTNLDKKGVSEQGKIKLENKKVM